MDQSLPSSILDRLAHWSATQPGDQLICTYLSYIINILTLTLFLDKIAWSFLDDKGDINDSYTYKELDRISSSLAFWLINATGLSKGDRVLLVFFPGLHFTISLLACFKAGIIAVPVFPPDPLKLAKDLHHFVSIQSNSGATVALTHSPYSFAKKVSDIQNLFSSKGIHEITLFPPTSTD